MSSAQPSALSTDEIARDARWLVQALDPASGLARLIEMDEDSYRAASFLDDRMLQQPLNTRTLPWQSVAQAVSPEMRRDARWVFHISHAGSTLLARLLGELPGVLAIREPRFLRDIGAMPASDRLPYSQAAQALFSRTFSSDQTALVKTTSFVSEFAPELVPPGARSLFMYTPPRTFITGILAGPNSLEEVRIRADVRARRIAGRVTGLDDQRQSDAHLAAAAWACEMTSLEAAADAMHDRPIEWANFDRMLDDMGASLSRSAAFFGFDAPEDQVRAIASGPLMRHYSKALEYEYSPAVRRELLTQTTRRQGRDIDEALAMLDRAAETSPLLARALALARSEEH